MTFDELLEIEPYSLDKKAKERLLTERLVQLTESHKDKCKEYSDILESTSYDKSKVKTYTDLPYLPVRLFKELNLKSVSDEEVVKTMTSSGTSGQRVSRIYLDKTTSSNQQKAMVKIVNNFTGSARMPMIIVDCPSVVKDRKMFSARGAGILGFSIFGSKKIYALNDDMKLDVDSLKEFLEKYKGEKILLFGFTFMVWQYFYKELVQLKEKGIVFDLSEGILIHGGGWKKLISEAVGPQEFHDSLKSVCGIDSVHDYYGMVEQTGCIYMQCEHGHLHSSIFSDVIARRPTDFSECEIGERGILQVVSTIPESYPGHSLLTEDEGIILGEDDCPCGRKGKYFQILGRLKNAEIRGCSDTFAVDNSGVKSSNTDSSDKNILSKISFLVGSSSIVHELPQVSPMVPFSSETITFLDEVSKELMSSREAKAFPDVITLGFWLRKSSVLKLKERFAFKDDNLHMGRGVAFHIAPSNVPVNYAYSLFTGLLCGNANVVRVPSKDFKQVTIINTAIKRVLERHENMKPYITLVRYDRNKDINDVFSSLCDVRIIWGGDSTIADLRKSVIPPRATEITFADRYSIAIIDSDYYMDIENKEKIAHDFYNDTYLTDQNACTSPRLVVWTGKKREEAKAIFWGKLHDMATRKYMIQPIQAVNKLTSSYLIAANFSNTKVISSSDNLLYRILIDELKEDLMNYKDNSGFFFEYDCDDLSSIKCICDNRCQTIGYIGKPSFLMPLLKCGIKGVDRIVPVGHTMDFDLLWDGYNLSERLTRTISIN